MRKISRAVSPVPGSLRAERLGELKRDLKRHFDLEREIRHRRRTPFDRERLIRSDVVDALQKVFEGRCAYCESLVSSAAENVDHFRPVAGTEDKEGYSPDHYGWFAYEWRNLLIVCPDCRRRKGSRFPVHGPRAPLVCSWTDASQLEDVELVDPTVDDPLVHLTLQFDCHLRPMSSKGEATIDLLDLNRVHLVHERTEEIQRLQHELIGSPQVDLIMTAVTNRKRRRGVALMFLRAISDHLDEFSRPSQRTSTSFLRRLPVLIRSVSTREWQEALEPYRYGGRQNFLLAYPSSAEKSILGDRADPSASARIRSISIKNFKGIGDLKLMLRATGETSFQAPCAMLLGENASGKSTVLQAICLALMAPAERRSLKLDAEDFLSREKSNWRLIDAPEGMVRIELDEGLTVDLHLKAGPAAFEGEGLPSLPVLAYGARRYFTQGRAKDSRGDATKTLFQPLATIRNPTRWLQLCTPMQFDAVARAMFEVLALDRDDRIFRDEDGNVLVRAHGREAPVARMSDGYKSLFAMAVDIMCRMVEYWGSLEAARGIVLIDEIETHLHPRWKMQVMGALRRSLPQVQFVATTHDPLCLRGMLDGEVHVLYRNEAGEISDVVDLPSVQGLRAEQLLTSDYFGLATTSDPKVERMLEEYVVRSSVSAGAEHPENAVLRASLARQLSELTVLGNDASQQIAAEALARYLAKRREASPIDRKAMREEAIRAVLDLLDAPST